MLPLLAASVLPASTAGETVPAPARIRALRPDLSPESPTFRAALLLLAVHRCGVNVDRLAARTRLPRPWVAACTRRLVDAGVWPADGAAADWPPEDFRFWNDVAVAEGRMLRRLDERGRVEWAPPGTWHKAFDYVRHEEPGAPVAYLDASPPAPVEDPPARAEAREPEARAPAHRPERRLEVVPPSRGPGRSAELFPGAAWMG